MSTFETPENDIPLIEIPDDLAAIIGEPDPGTRMFRRYGFKDDFSSWFDAVTEMCEPENCVSPGGVALYARVSRAGVHKRMKEGRITAFLFHVVEGVSRWTRREILANAGQPYIFIPVVECKAWADLLATKPRSERKKEEFGDKDFVGRFLIPKPRKVERPGKGGRKQ